MLKLKQHTVFAIVNIATFKQQFLEIRFIMNIKVMMAQAHFCAVVFYSL